MATLTYNRFFAPSARLETAPQEARPVSEAPRQEQLSLRAIPFEEVYFIRKILDNSRVIRQQDPQERKICWSFLLGCIAIVTLVIALLIPGAFGMVDGYTIQALKQERQKLLRERSVLELEEARRLSPQRLEELARIQQFVDPGPEQLIYLDKGDTVARNNGAPKQ
ncbi:MAG: hypothetical protein NTY38_24080 [Acidobacteria bacterium]|nr:hypothetical protein [Acidobacteriota bacterium]